MWKKICCNPDHLVLGSQQQNAIDNIHHGKSIAKLTPELVRDIRATKGKDGLIQKQRAIKYKVTVGTISSVENNRTWKHVI